jgi:hypothetical protein
VPYGPAGRYGISLSHEREPTTSRPRISTRLAEPSAAELQYKALACPVYDNPEGSYADPTREAALSEALKKRVEELPDSVKGAVRLLKVGSTGLTQRA